MKTQLSKSADQKIRTKGILCAQMREIKRKNTLDRKSNVEKTLILSRVFLFWIRGVRNQCFPTAPFAISLTCFCEFCFTFWAGNTNTSLPLWNADFLSASRTFVNVMCFSLFHNRFFRTNLL